jgi:hypothetical protein
LGDREMIKYLRLIVPIFLLICPVSYGEQLPDFKETKIGGFNFASKLITNQELEKLYGKGCVDKDYPYHYRRLYYFPERNIYAAFNVETDNLVVGLKLTKETITDKKCKAKRNLKNLETGKKIKIGDPKDKVIKVYGKPSEEKIKSNNVVLYRYYVGRQEGPYMEIELLKDRVNSIWITVGD